MDNKEEKIINERKKKIFNLFKKTNFLIIILLIGALILGIYIRSLPMADHSGMPGLWDVTTNTWTLGPDLDPFLFLRYAKDIVQNGTLAITDNMRNVPLGYDTTAETRLLPYMIDWTYHITSLFNKNVNVEYAAVVFPVIMFALTIIIFFLFVREIFSREDKKENDKANIISLIATLFMIVIPVFLPRTIAGIPEKESAGFFFMFLALYFFLSSWKSKTKFKIISLAISSGIATALMGLIWGGVVYVFVGVAAAVFIAFILNKVKRKEFVIYSLWIFFAYSIILLLSNRYSIKGLISSLDSGLAFIVFFIILIHFLLWNTKFSKTNFVKRIKLPKQITSLIFAIIISIILVLIMFGPGFIIEKAKAVNQIMFSPVTGRWGTTVAENRQPYFTEWTNEFGPSVKGFPLTFWLFFVGSVFLFKKMLKNVNKKDAITLTLLYVFFFFGLVFSRYSESSTFNGVNLISKIFYYGSSLLLLGYILYYYINYEKKNNPAFEKIDFELILLFSLFILCLFTARSAVRLIMVLAPIAVIFLAYLIVILFYKFLETKDDSMKFLVGSFFIVILILSIYSFTGFYKSSKSQSYSYVPNAYSYQWQYAMKWVRENTPSNAVFAHWWDYGYWVQSMGNRATVTDGGNAIVWWNYLTGRYVITGDNQKQALEFLYNHNATNLLIDSSDIGKYGAFSKIGSDKNYDRFSYGPVVGISDESNIQETKDGSVIPYPMNSIIEDDINYNENGTKIFIPGISVDSNDQIRASGGIIGVFLETSNQNGSIVSFKQPTAVYYYQGKQYQLPLRYLVYKGQIKDFNNGIDGAFVVIQKVEQTNAGFSVNELGAGMYLSPRILKTLFAQKYILDDPFNNFNNFNLAYSQNDVVIDYFNQQGLNLDEFVYYNGIRGPIKIWDIKYNGDEKINETYLRISPPAEITWNF
jgi:asparagine N-glycosylation enzyme membrane subunit Stt3